MSTQLINQVLELTNIERANAGLEPLKLNNKLANAADEHSDSMAKDDFFSHTGADGSSVSDRVQSNGYEYSTVGENIAAGYATAEAVVQGWMDSPGHRANILNANFSEIGIGYEYLENDTGAVNYNHYWTQVFGTSLNNDSQFNTSAESDLETENSLPLEPVEDTAAEPQEPQDLSPEIANEDGEINEDLADVTPEVELSTDSPSEVMEEDAKIDDWDLDYSSGNNSQNDITGNEGDTAMTGGDSFDFNSQESSNNSQNNEFDYQQLQDMFSNIGFSNWMEYIDEYQEIMLEGYENHNFESESNLVEY